MDYSLCLFVSLYTSFFLSLRQSSTMHIEHEYHCLNWRQLETTNQTSPALWIVIAQTCCRSIKTGSATARDENSIWNTKISHLINILQFPQKSRLDWAFTEASSSTEKGVHLLRRHRFSMRTTPERQRFPANQHSSLFPSKSKWNNVQRFDLYSKHLNIYIDMIHSKMIETTIKEQLGCHQNQPVSTSH